MKLPPQNHRWLLLLQSWHSHSKSYKEKQKNEKVCHSEGKIQMVHPASAQAWSHSQSEVRRRSRNTVSALAKPKTASNDLHFLPLMVMCSPLLVKSDYPTSPVDYHRSGHVWLPRLSIKHFAISSLGCWMTHLGKCSPPCHEETPTVAFALFYSLKARDHAAHVGREEITCREKWQRCQKEGIIGAPCRSCFPLYFLLLLSSLLSFFPPLFLIFPFLHPTFTEGLLLSMQHEESSVSPH